MTTILPREPGAPPSAPGRPAEVEDPSNRFLVHPASRRLVDWLIATPVTPNQVSVSSVFAAAAAAWCYVGLPWPWSAFLGLAFHLIWHVLDGADGDLARRTGRASAYGELVDGVCDHVSQALIYVAFAFALQPRLGGWAWSLAVAAGVSHFVQANAYESGRKTYRRWVYGAPWMRQTGAGAGGLGGWLGGLYLSLSEALSPGEGRIELAMRAVFARGEVAAAAARRRYGEVFAPLVKQSGLLGSNTRTLAAFLSILAGSPIWFFLFELTALNLVLTAAIWRRGRLNAMFAPALEAGV
jgi:phosphatidylglycerophosphate synthase